MKKLIIIFLLLLIVSFQSYGQITINSATNWSAVIASNGLNTTTLTSESINVNADLTMDVDYEFNDCEFVFGNTIPLILNSTKELTLQNCNLSSSGSNIWTGIRVNDEAILNMSDCYLEKANDGIYATNHAVLLLKNNEFYNCDNSGLYTDGDVYILEIADNLFSESLTGISINNSSIMINLAAPIGHENIFRDFHDYGIESISATVNIRNNIFEILNFTSIWNTNSFSGIYFLNNTKSRIRYNKFIDLPRAILSLGSFNEFISYNEINNDFTGLGAITSNQLLNVSVAKLHRTHHNEIFSKGDGCASAVRLINGNGYYFANNKIKGTQMKVKVANSSYSLIRNNEIEFEVNESIGCVDNPSNNALIFGGLGSHTSIIGNRLKFEANNIAISTHLAGIRLVESERAHILSNNIVSNFTVDNIGINLKQSSNSTIRCNDIDVQNIGIQFEGNSDIHYIRANTIDAGTYDLFSAFCVLNQQDHLGNEFKGGYVKAFGSPSQITMSRFFVNSTETFHMPTNPNPSTGWFFDETLQDDLGCLDDGGTTTGEGGNLGLAFHGDDTKVSSYLDILASVSNANSNQHFVKLFNLLSFYESEPSIEMPESLTNYLENNEICGLSQIIDAHHSIFEMDLPSSIDLAENDLSNERMEESIKKIDKNTAMSKSEFIAISQNIKEEITAGKIIYNEWIAYENNVYAVSRDILTNIDCTEDISTVWKNVLLHYLDYKQDIVFEEKEKEYLTEVSQLCPTDYGKVVYLAQGLLVGFENVDFDMNKGCVENRSSQSQNAKKSNKNQFIVSPNPSRGVFSIDINEQSSLKSLEIYDMGGLSVWNKQITEVGSIIIQVNLNEGIYFLKSRLTDGTTEIEKIIITE